MKGTREGKNLCKNDDLIENLLEDSRTKALNCWDTMDNFSGT